MGRLMKIVSAIRNNWKKSALASVALAYGANFGKEKYDTHQLMRHYCEIASRCGEVPHPVIKPFRKITVILNPAANKRKSKSLFEKYCAPLLYLAGISVTVVQTEYSGQPKELLNSLDPDTDAIVIAGGDGTLSETVTGLLRRADDNLSVVKKLPIGVLPLGQTSLLGNTLFTDKNMVQSLINATMAVIDGKTEAVDVIKIQPLQEENETEEPSKPTYSLGQLEWGSFRDALARRDKYWYFGPFKKYMSYVFSSAEPNSWTCVYTEPCSGCSKCHVPVVDKSSRRWWYVFLPGKTKTPEVDYSQIINENCGELNQKELETVEFKVCTRTINKIDSETPSLLLNVGANNMSWTQFVSEGWSRLNGEISPPVVQIPVRSIQLKPVHEAQDAWLSIDSEDFEVRPIELTVLPKTVSLFVTSKVYPQPDVK